MTLQTCLEIGYACGLETWEECYDNIDYHASSLFGWNDIGKELLELQKDMYHTDKEKFCKIFKVTKEEMKQKGW